MRPRSCLPLLLLASCQAARIDHDVLLRGGTVYDGTGAAAFVADVAIDGDRIAAVGDMSDRRARLELDAHGMAVAPGFVNVLSWATETLIEDGRARSDVAQGVTLEVFGEGWSMGPWNRRMRRRVEQQQTAIRYPVSWKTLDEYLSFLVRRGVAPNVASFVGATTLRVHQLGYEDRPPTERELARMCQLAEEAMEDGALGLGSALIYAPGTYAETAELVELARAVGRHGGRYVTHMRSEGDRLLEAIEETATIAREAGVGAEIYHLKAAGTRNWETLEQAIGRIEELRAEGLDLTADVYPYTAGATGLDASMPPWVQEGGLAAWIERLQDPETRARVEREMNAPADDWENLFEAAGAGGMLLVEFRTPKLQHLMGRTLADVARERGTSPAVTAMDLVVEDGSRVETIYFLMSERNVQRKLGLPWVSVCSDAGAPAAEGVFLESRPHPRAYGSFARVLGLYARDLGVLSLEEAVRRMTWFPSRNLGLRGRGLLAEGYHADVVVFDPDEVQDRATFAEPHRLATGVEEVFVNGRRVLADGEPTGALPGRVVRGPGWRGWND